MATDYNEIGRNPRINYRKIFTPYSDKTHFIYELIQNADDNESECIELQLYENELIVWNDGNEFREEDVRSICSIGFSNKDLTQIGTFGMGFKAVYAYTDSPEVYSGDECFRISINNPTKPEGIDDIDNTRIVEQRKKGKQLKENRTIFRLPFREDLHPEEIALLKNRLSDLERRSLLFLRNLKTVRWYDENSGQMGIYSCYRRDHDKIQDPFEVELRASLNGEDQSSETFLVFRKRVQPLPTVINELLQQSENEDERQRIEKSAEKPQPVEVAFKFQDGKIIAMNNCVLFSYFPTQKETHLQFLIQAAYKTTLARDNIEKGNQWNKWLIQETADFFPKVLEQLKDKGLLEPAFFNMLPLKEDDVPAEFTPITEVLKEMIRDLPIIPTQDGGHAKAENVFYPHSGSLRQLVESSWLHPSSNWLHPDIQDNKQFRQCFEVIREAGVKKVSVNQVLRWFESRDFDWFRDQSNEWLCSLYAYLKEQESQSERIKKLPLVRLENGQHVCASDRLVFFPFDIDEEHEEIKPFLGDLPILRSALLEGSEHKEIKDFLRRMGVKKLRPVDLISEGIFPQYNGSVQPSIEKNCQHIRYIFKTWQKSSKSERRRLEGKINEIPILQAYKDSKSKISDESMHLSDQPYYVKPCDAYLSQVYTSNSDLETYFSVCDGDILFVDAGYLKDNSDVKTWLKFLKAIGAMDTPKVIKKSITINHENLQELDKRGIKRGQNTQDGTIEDSCLHGLAEVLDEINKDKKVELSWVLWSLLVKTIPSGKSKRNAFFQGVYRQPDRRNQQKFDATFYSQLNDVTWLPDEQGNLHIPSECSVSTPENRSVLADNVSYLPDDFDVSDESTQWLANKLEIHLSANTDSVLSWIIPQYSQTNKPSVDQNRRHMRCLFKVWENTSKTERKGLKGKVGKTEILLAYKGNHRESLDFRAPCDIYLSQPYSGDAHLETYFSVCDRDIWFVDDAYLENNSDTRAWFQFLKGIGAMDTPQITKEKKHIGDTPLKFEVSAVRRKDKICEESYLEGLSEVLNRITENQRVDLSISLWHLLIKSLPSEKSERDIFFQGTCQSYYLSKCYDALCYIMLTERYDWLPDKQGRFHSPSKCFASTPENCKVLADSVIYLHPDFDISSEPAQWLGEKLGIRLEADKESVLNHLQELSGKKISVEKVEPIYDFLNQQSSYRRSEFKKKPLIFIPEPEPNWWQVDEVFWEDESEFFGNDRGYLKAHYPQTLKSFFINLEVPERASVLDYIDGIQEIASEKDAKDNAIRNRIKRLYAHLRFPMLQSEVTEKWEGAREGKCWLGKIGNEWNFFTRQELVLRDYNYRAEIFEGKVPFWAFNNDLLTLVQNLELEGCSQAVIECLPSGKQAADEHWTQRVQNLCRYIYGFLNSPVLYSEKVEAIKSVQILEHLSVCQVDELRVTYELKGIPIADPDPRQSFVDASDDNGILWLGSKVSEDNYAELIGDALQDYFKAKDLGRFVEDLLTKNRDEVLARWKRDGLQTDLCVLPSEVDVKADIEKVPKSVDEKPLHEKSVEDDSGTGDSEVETLTIHEEPETENEDDDSTENESGTPTYKPRLGGSGTRPRGGTWSSKPNRNKDTGYSSGGGGSGPSEEHEDLKDYIADNPSELGNGLKLVKKEYTFKLGGRVDILLQDSSGNPVTVEVKPYHIPPESNDEIWQAVRYKHVAAAEYGLRCDQVRSILVAPAIHNDVKAKCRQLGIEPVEKPEL